jgi:hypothetical protein
VHTQLRAGGAKPAVLPRGMTIPHDEDKADRESSASERRAEKPKMKKQASSSTFFLT